MTCPTCVDLISRRAVATLADHLEKRHQVRFGVRNQAQRMVFGTVGAKE